MLFFMFRLLAGRAARRTLFSHRGGAGGGNPYQNLPPMPRLPAISVQVDDQELRYALKALADAGKDLRPALQDIGELLVDSTKQRFGTSTAPDGTPWAPNSPATLVRWMRRGGSGVKRPLIGNGKSLLEQISRHINGSGDELEVGSSMPYAAAQQFGMKKGYAGETSRGSPIPWGDIPARPFIGISDADHQHILDIIADHLAGSF